MKQPNWKAPLILSFILLVFGSFAYWLQYSHKPKKEKAETFTKKPIALPSEDVQIIHFRIKSANGVIEGTCNSVAQKTCKTTTQGDWTLTYPITAKGDADAIKDFLNNQASMVATETIDLSEDTEEKRKQLIDEYGLSDEKRTRMGAEFVELTTEDGRKYAAWFGEPHPVGDKNFVASAIDGQLNQKTIFLISNFYKSVFEKNVTHFRDKTLFNFSRVDITSFEAKTTAGKITGVQENNQWTINGRPGDYDQIETVLSSIAQLKAKDFPDPSAIKGARTIVAYDLKTKTTNFHLELLEKTEPAPKGAGKAQPGHSTYYVNATGLKDPVEVEALFRSQVDKKPNELRKRVLMTDAQKVTLTELKIEGKEFPAPPEFHYNGKGWVQKSGAAKLDVSKVQAMIDQFTTARAQDFRSPAPSSKKEAITVSLGDEKDPTHLRFSFYLTQEKDKVFAQDLSTGVNEAFVMDASFKNALPFTPESWKMK